MKRKCYVVVDTNVLALAFIKEWGLYAYKDLRRLTNKGGQIERIP